MSDETMTEELEGRAEAMAMVPAYAVIKAENDSLATMARLHPRNQKKCLDRALAEIKMIPEEAATMFYSIPYWDSRKGKNVNVEGLSIKAAMMIARIWGNCNVSGRMVEDTDDSATVEGVFIDMETGFRLCRPLKISKYLKNRKTGEVYKLDDQKQIQATQAGVSKAIRNAVLGGISGAILSKIHKAAKAAAAGNVAEVVPSLIKAFADMGVTEEMLKKKIGCALLRATPDDIATLLGYGSAIKDGLSSIEEIFQDEPKEAAPKKQPDITLQDVMQGTAEPPSDEEPHPQASQPMAVPPEAAAAPQEVPPEAANAAPQKESTRRITW